MALNMEKALTIPTPDVNFYAVQRGDQPRAVFLHGFSGDVGSWDAVWAELGADFPALRYDLRGFGQSLDRDGKPFSHADDLLAVLDALHIPCCDLVGVSMGGAVAINFALNYPDRVRKLVLISPALVAWDWSEDWKNLWRPIVACARAGDMDQARLLWWRHPLFATTRDSAAAQTLFRAILRYSGDQWVQDNQRRELPDVERLHLLQSPTLLLTGGRDLDDFRLIADIVAASVANLTRVDFPNLGHLLNLEEPKTCAGNIRGFLDKV